MSANQKDPLDGIIGKLKDRQQAVLVAAYKKAQDAVSTAPTAANIRAVSAAEQALGEYEKAQAAADGGAVTFDTGSEVYRYLEAAGWKCAISTVYNHIKAGKLKKGKGDVYHKRTVDRYADAHLTPGDMPDEEDIDRRKKEAEARKADAQATHWETRTALETGALVPREWVEQQMSAKAALLKSDYENTVRARAGDITALVEGNPQKTPELVAFLIELGLDWFARYAEPVAFQVPKIVEVKHAEIA